MGTDALRMLTRLVLLLFAMASAAASTADVIVSFADGATKAEQDAIVERVTNAGGNIKFRYSTVMQGFAGSLPSSLLEELKASPVVKRVENDGEVRALKGEGEGAGVMGVGMV